MQEKASIITPEIIKEREERHRRLMRMIKNFRKTNQQIRTLQKIKNNTVMEINLRYLRSKHNREYVFPKAYSSESEDQLTNEEIRNPFTLKENILYDLRTQNQVKPESHKKISDSYEHSHRVKSLEREKSDIVEHRIGRLKQLKQRELSYRKLKKKSMADQKRVLSTLKLPQLKKQKIKTEEKHINESIEMQRIIGKKLMTEASTPIKKQVVSKYLQKEGERKSRKKLTSLKKIN